jgi:hypothetical protein
MASQNQKFVFGSILLVMLTLVLYYAYLSYQWKYPNLAMHLPESDIVFFDAASHQLGFLEIDTSNISYIVLDFAQRRTSFKNGPLASDALGEYLSIKISHYNPNAGVPILIDVEGNVIWCNNFEFPGFRGRAIIQADQRVLLSLYQPYEQDQIVEFNMRTCQIESILYVSTLEYDKTVEIEDFAISPTGWLAVVQPDPVAFFTTIVISPAGQFEEKISGARCPAWSHDGQHFAYVTDDGVFVTDSKGRNANQVSPYSSSTQCISWHWTKNYLLFQVDHALKILDMGSGKSIEIGSEGVIPGYPIWRPTDWEFPDQ